MAQRIFAPNIRPTKNPPVRPYFKNKKITKKNCCSFSARKHPTPPGTGTEPGASSGLGAAPAPGSRQFSQALLAVGPPVDTDPREKKPGKPQVRTRPRFCFFSEVSFLKADFANKQSEPIQRARRTSSQTARLASKSRDIGTPDWHGARCLLFAWAALAVDVLFQGPWGCLIFFVLNPRSRAPTAAIAAQAVQ